jgi:hypothetical protein
MIKKIAKKKISPKKTRREGTKTKQKSTKYRPTVKEKDLLEVLLNPEHRFKSITDICLLAHCTRNIYYNAFEKPDFCKYYERQVDRLIDKSYAAMINASLRAAVRGDATHLRILLQMKGKLADRVIFPGKDGEPQDLTSKQLSANEIARRVSIIFQKGLKRKEEAEKKNAASRS